MTEIGEMSTTLRMTEGDSMSPAARSFIREQAVLAVREYLEHEKRVRDEQRLTGGVYDDQEGEG